MQMIYPYFATSLVLDATQQQLLGKIDLESFSTNLAGSVLFYHANLCFSVKKFHGI